MNSSRADDRPLGWRDALVAVGLFTAVFTWQYWSVLGDRLYLIESDLFEYYLPLFLSPFLNWSSFEFAGLPAFGDPGEATAYPLHLLFSKVIGSWSAYAVSAHVVGATGVAWYVFGATRSRASALFAGLAFGVSEAMVERIAHMQTLHVIAWLPYMFVAIDHLRARDGRARVIGLGALAVACAILAGHPQPVIYAGLAAMVYLVVSGLAERADRAYYVAGVAMFSLGALLSAIKLLPFAQVTGQLARGELSFNQFVGRGNSPAQMWGVLFPTIVHDGREAPLYVGLATLVLAGVGVSLAVRHWRARYWVGLVVLTVMLALGDHTPVARFFYTFVPGYDHFRVIARHLILTSLGCTVLAGLGLDQILRRQVSPRVIGASLGCLVLAMFAGAMYLAHPPADLGFEVRSALPWTSWGLPSVLADAMWTQLAIGVVTIGVVTLVASGRAATVGVAALLVLLVGDSLNALPYPVGLDGVHHITMPAAAAGPSVHARRIRDELAPTQQRLLTMAGTDVDDVAPAAWSRIWRIPSAGGYGPMLLESHSQLAGMGRDGGIRPRMLYERDRGLDLLALKYLLVQPSDLEPGATFDADGVTWNRTALDIQTGRDECGDYTFERSATLPLPTEIEASSLELVLYMRCGDEVPQGTSVGTIAVTDTAGQATTVTLYAGVNISDAAIGDAGVRASAKHQPTPAFNEPGDDGRVRTHVSVKLAAPTHLQRVTVTVPPFRGWLVLNHATVVDAAGASHPQAEVPSYLRDGQRWREVRRFRTSRISDRVADEDAPGEHDYTLYENLRARPRAWVVGALRVLDDRQVLEALRTSQFPDGAAFDPAAVALVTEGEARPSSLSFSPGASTVKVLDADNGHTALDVSSEGGGFLVLSESWLSGWTATVDGASVPVYRANLSQQGIVVPAGQHRVAFAFRPLSLTIGEGLTGASLLVVAWLLVPRRRRALTSPER